MKKFLFFVAVSMLLVACNNKPADTTAAKTDTTATTATETKAPQQAEFADAKYTELGKKLTAALASGNVDAWGDVYSDDAKYRWSSGDSLTGKAAILKYWKDRRANVIDSIQFLNDIWLPIKVNTPQQGPDRKGVWLLSWYWTNVKYKNGKRLVFGVHTLYHFNDADKVDESIQYIDRAPINKALGVK